MKTRPPRIERGIVAADILPDRRVISREHETHARHTLTSESWSFNLGIWKNPSFLFARALGSVSLSDFTVRDVKASVSRVI